MSTRGYSEPMIAKEPESLAITAISRGSDTTEARAIALFRFVIALAALTIVWFDPGRPAWLSTLTYSSVISYLIYTIVVAWLCYRRGWSRSPSVLHWIDVLVFAYLLALTHASHSVSLVFLYFFFAILIASFSGGFREGFAVTLTAAGLALFVIAVVVPWQLELFFREIFVHGFYLLFFGFVIAYFGGRRHLSMLRLALLKNINDQLNPRFGVDHLNEANLQLLLKFYGADACILAVRRPAPGERYVAYSAFPDGKDGGTQTELGAAVAGALLRPLPGVFAGFFHAPEGNWRQRLRGYYSFDYDLRRGEKGFQGACAGLANLLDTKAFITVPYVEHGGTIGRLFIASERGEFSAGDIEFLLLVSGTMATVVENMSLVEELVSKAAEHERTLVSRDLHDTTIQPYIGLKLALEALQREAGQADILSARIGEVITMTEMTIRDLRDYASNLREKAVLPGEFLVEAVERQVERLGRFYGIEVEVKSSLSANLTGRLAADAYQIIAEGLSNILRHTRARKAFVSILCEDAFLLLKLGNEAGEEKVPAKEFTPKSIIERSRLRGGQVVVEHRDDGYTVVNVTIPMQG